VPLAVDTYRKALAGAEDNSVVISAIGMTTNLRDLLQSKGDATSHLNGVDLVAAKVKTVVWMDGDYNFGCAQYRYDRWLGSDDGCRGSA
jgi:hypothetical protein